MAYKDKAFSDGTPVKWKYWACPECGIKASTERRYCACHADLSSEVLHISSEEPPEMLGIVNMDLPYFTCSECENCAYCASFGAVNKNPNGFGGLDCGYRNNSVRCQCCKIQIKSFVEFGAGDKAIKEGLKRLESYRGNL